MSVHQQLQGALGRIEEEAMSLFHEHPSHAESCSSYVEHYGTQCPCSSHLKNLNSREVVTILRELDERNPDLALWRLRTEIFDMLFCDAAPRMGESPIKGTQTQHPDRDRVTETTFSSLTQLEREVRAMNEGSYYVYSHYSLEQEEHHWSYQAFDISPDNNKVRFYASLNPYDRDAEDVYPPEITVRLSDLIPSYFANAEALEQHLKDVIYDVYRGR